MDRRLFVYLTKFYLKRFCKWDSKTGGVMKRINIFADSL